GFGHIDALAAVRLAETWTGQSTFANLRVQEGQVSSASLTVGAGGSAEAGAVFAVDARVEHVVVDVHLEAAELEGVTLVLIAPSGTVSRLIDTPPEFPDKAPLPESLQVSLMSVRSWGEDLAGEWTLRLSNAADGQPVELLDWSIRAHTPDDAATASDQQVFT